MTIDRTKVKPSYYIEYDGIDISEYVVETGRMTINTKNKITSGRFFLDTDVGLSIKKYYKEVGFLG